jgi:hypothetical protein
MGLGVHNLFPYPQLLRVVVKETDANNPSSFLNSRNKGALFMSKTDRRRVKFLTGPEWNKIMRKDRTNEFIKVPVDLFSNNPKLINDYVETEFDLNEFRNFKAFVALQNEMQSITEKEDAEELDDMEHQDLSVAKYKRFKLPQMIKETGLSVSIQNAYRNDTKFLKLPFKAFDKARGKLSMLVDALLETYNIHSEELLWRVVASLYGTETFDGYKVKEAYRKRNPEPVEAVEEVSD